MISFIFDNFLFLSQIIELRIKKSIMNNKIIIISFISIIINKKMIISLLIH